MFFGLIIIIGIGFEAIEFLWVTKVLLLEFEVLKLSKSMNILAGLYLVMEVLLKLIPFVSLKALITWALLVYTNC